MKRTNRNIKKGLAQIDAMNEVAEKTREECAVFAENWQGPNDGTPIDDVGVEIAKGIRDLK